MKIDTSIELTKDDFIDIAWHCSSKEAETILEEFGTRFGIDTSNIIEGIHKVAEKNRYVSDFY